MPDQDPVATAGQARSPDDVLLRVEHLTTTFDAAGASIRAVDDVSFTVGVRETVALVGE